MKNGVSSVRLLAGLLGLLVVGCPIIKITDVGIKAGSIGEGAFTLTAAAKAEYERDECKPGPDGGREPGEPAPDDCEPDPETMDGHGVVGVWLPEGWRVVEARLAATKGAEEQTLVATPAAAPAFVTPYPTYPGRWWPFVTTCLVIREGTTEYAFEFDVAGPADQRLLRAAVASDAYDISWHEDEEPTFAIQGSPTFAIVDLDAGSTERHWIEQEEVHLDLERCSAPVEARVDRGPRGCSCATVGGAPGAVRAGPGLLIQLLGVTAAI